MACNSIFMNFFVISVANIWPNLFHQNRIPQHITLTPCS